MLPRAWREEIIEGLLGSSLIGFHTHDYVRYFLTSVLRPAGYEHQLGSLALRDRVVKVDTFPMGVEFDHFAEAAASEETALRVEKLREKCVGQKVIFSVDRLDYTKGLIDRLRGYELFLKNNPQWHGKVVFVVSVAPSRIGVDSYQAMKLELEQTVGRIRRDGNGEFFELRVPTHLSETLDVSVVQAEPKRRHLLLFVRKQGEKPQLDRFLCGHDEREWFVAAVPGGASSVRQAMDALQPKDIRDALTRNQVSSRKRYARKNRAFRRQGE
jgi:hypothetical protein